VSLRNTLQLYLTLALLILSGIQYGMTYLTLLGTLEASGEQYARTTLQHLDTLIQDRLQQLDDSVTDWAEWDDTYQFMTQRHAEYLESNYTQATHTRLKVDVIILLDQQGRPVLERSLDHVNQTPWPIPGTLRAALAGRDLQPTSREGHRGLLRLEDGLLMFAVHPVVRSDGSGEPLGTLFMGQRVGEAIVHQLAASAHVQLVAQPLPAHEPWSRHPKLNTVELMRHGTLLGQHHGEQLTGYLLLRDYLQQPALLFEVALVHAYTLPWSALLRDIAVTLATIGILVILFGRLLDQRLTHPIARITEAMGAIGTAEEPDATSSLQIPAAPYPDDDAFSTLTHATNTMLQRLAAQTHLLQQELDTMQLIRMVFEQSGAMIIVTDRHNRIVMANPHFYRVTGHIARHVLGKQPQILQSEQHGDAFYTAMWNSLNHTGHWQGALWNRRKNGELFPEWLVIRAVRNSADEITHHIGIGTDLTEQWQEELFPEDLTVSISMHSLVHYEPLTQLPNRFLFHDRLEQALMQALEAPQEPPGNVGVMLIRVRGFAALLTTVGHQYSNTVVRNLALRMRTVLAPHYTLARMQEDGFAVLLPRLPDRSTMVDLAHQLRQTMSEPDHGACEIHPEVQIGLAMAPQDGTTAHELLRNAESSMLEA
jgi:PAS domain S-box-containing protein/diguanylate cyclase (GGDEF)-like protein